MTVHIGLDLPPEQYRALAKIATARHTQVHHLIEQLVHHALKPKAVPASIDSRLSAAETQQLQEDILRLHTSGRTDRQIAENLGAKRSRVTYLRARMNLASNDPRGRKKTTPNQIESTTA
jgi:DNA-binding NarL/FixJ family response regulator